MRACSIGCTADVNAPLTTSTRVLLCAGSTPEATFPRTTCPFLNSAALRAATLKKFCRRRPLLPPTLAPAAAKQRQWPKSCRCPRSTSKEAVGTKTCTAAVVRPMRQHPQLPRRRLTRLPPRRAPPPPHLRPHLLPLRRQPHRRRPRRQHRQPRRAPPNARSP
jgi:hypothetical protein